jgi:hypothetical protein
VSPSCPSSGDASSLACDEASLPLIQSEPFRGDGECDDDLLLFRAFVNHLEKKRTLTPGQEEDSLDRTVHRKIQGYEA